MAEDVPAKKNASSILPGSEAGGFEGRRHGDKGNPTPTATPTVQEYAYRCLGLHLPGAWCIAGQECSRNRLQGVALAMTSPSHRHTMIPSTCMNPMTHSPYLVCAECGLEQT